MAICRACLAEGEGIIKMDEDFVTKYNILTNLDIKPEETLYTCQECSNAVQFCIDFRDNCIASNLAFMSLEEAKKDSTSEIPDDEDLIDPTSKIPDDEDLIDPTSKIPDDEDLIYPTSKTPDDEDLIDPTSKTPDYEDLIYPTSKTPDDEDLIDPTSKTPDNEDLIYRTSKTPDDEDLIDPTSKTPDDEDLIDPTSKTPDDEDLIDPTSKTPDDEDLIDPTSKTPDDEDLIFIKEELQVEYDDSKIEHEHLDNFHSDDEITLSKLSAAIHDEDIKLTEKEDSKREDKVTTKRKSDARTCRKRVARKELVKRVLKKASRIELSETEPCGLCPKTLKNAEDLKRHLGHHKLDVPCSFCPQHFISLPHLYSHRILHIPEDKRRCHMCNKTAWNIEFLEFHYMRAHNMADKDERLRCKLCTTTTASVRQMHRHMKNHAELKHKCKICNKSFARQHTLRLHAFVHNTEKLRCDKCDFVTKSPKGLAHHQLRKHTEGRVYCKVCRRPFRTQALCDAHKCRTTESIVCSVCGFIAKDDKSYKEHKSVHDTVMRYKCEKCPAKFRAKSSLSIHRDKHAGTPRQKCGVCGRAFYSASVLIKHKRIHTGEKPYVCEVCNKGFTAKHNLKVHMKIHGIYNLIKPKPAEDDDSLDVDQ